MEGQTKITWDFLQAAYRAGALDEFLSAARPLTDKKYDNQATVFAELEDAVFEMEDFSSVDEVLDTAFKLLPEMTDQEALEGLAIILSLLNPLIKSFMEGMDRDTEAVVSMKDELAEKGRKVAKALAMLGSVGAKQVLVSSGGKSPADLGRSMGRAINKTTAAFNELSRDNPRAVSEFMSGLFREVDGKDMRAMTEALTNGFLDQDPPIFKWIAAALVGRVKRRLFNK